MRLVGLERAHVVTDRLAGVDGWPHKVEDRQGIDLRGGPRRQDVERVDTAFSEENRLGCVVENAADLRRKTEAVPIGSPRKTRCKCHWRMHRDKYSIANIEDLEYNTNMDRKERDEKAGDPRDPIAHFKYTLGSMTTAFFPCRESSASTRACLAASRTISNGTGPSLKSSMAGKRKVERGWQTKRKNDGRSAAACGLPPRSKRDGKNSTNKSRSDISSQLPGTRYTEYSILGKPRF